jgi:hypothetical protein
MCLWKSSEEQRVGGKCQAKKLKIGVVRIGILVGVGIFIKISMEMKIFAGIFVTSGIFISVIAAGWHQQLP